MLPLPPHQRKQPQNHGHNIQQQLLYHTTVEVHTRQPHQRLLATSTAQPLPPHRSHRNNQHANHHILRPGMRTTSILLKPRGSGQPNEPCNESAAYHMGGTAKQDFLAPRQYLKQPTDGCTTFHPKKHANTCELMRIKPWHTIYTADPALSRLLAF